MDEQIKAISTRDGRERYAHSVQIRGHRFMIDEPPEKGGEDQGPTPQELLAASLASCTAVTIEMYARRKEWDIGPIEVECEYAPGGRGAPTRFMLVLRLPSELSEEQVERLLVIAAKCPVHRTLEGEVVFEERVEPAGAATT